MGIKHSPGCKCCKCPLCIAVTVCGVSTEGYAGFSVSLSGTGGDYGPCDPTEDGVCCFEVPPGSYTITGTGPCGEETKIVTVTCPGGLDTTIDIPGATVTIDQDPAACTGAYLTGALSGPNGFVTGVGGSGHSEVCVPVDGSYTIDWLMDQPCIAPLPPSMVTVEACEGSTSLTIDLVRVDVIVTVRGCGDLLLPGATVDITGPGFTFTGTTDASGQVTATNLIGGCDYVLTVSKPPYFRTEIVDFTASCFTGGGQNVTLFVLSDEVVCVPCCPDPIKKVLTLTSAAGDIDLVYAGDEPFVGDLWIGCQSWPGQTTTCQDGFGGNAPMPCTGQLITASVAIVWEWGPRLGSPCGTLIQKWSCCGTAEDGFDLMPGSCLGTFPFFTIRSGNTDDCLVAGYSDYNCQDTASAYTTLACDPLNALFTFADAPLATATLTEP